MSPYMQSSSPRLSTPSSEQACDAQNIVSDVIYARTSGEGNSELPLSQQLEPIAVVGMGCRIPGDVRSPSDLWRMMMDKRAGQTPKVPASRFNIDAYYHANNDRPGSFGAFGGYFLQETLQEFDPSFFGITPVEAMWMDPQQRKLLEVVYETFESAGLTLDTLSGSDTACFVASFTSDFQQMAFREPSFRHNLAATGVDPGIISNRISHAFNLKGPSIVVNTACSSSVYALHNACNALRNRECGAAVVGGVNLILNVDQHMNTAKLGVLSSTSTCHTFNEHADGYGRAEGVGAIYLKRLRDAVRDGDPIRGVIRSSATNNNGKVPAVGITHPSFAGQVNVIRNAYERGGALDPLLTGYFECHGTGTAIGDPLETHAVAEAMNEDRLGEHGPLFIGAVKTNIGHSEAASGLTAIIKAIMAVERGIIPPTRGVAKLNPAIDWVDWKVKVVTDSSPFPAHLPLKRASVNSFGYGGTNAHVVVESADSLLSLPQKYAYASYQQKSEARTVRGGFHRNRPLLLVFSAHDRPTLERNIKAHGAVINDYDLLDVSHTLANHRTRFPVKAMAVLNYANIKHAFDDGLQEFTFLEDKTTTVKTLGFVFTGQGAQWARMGAELITYYPSFARSIRQLDKVLEDLDDCPDWTLDDILLEDPKASRINEAEFSQPLCTAIQIALVQLLRSWNIQPVVTVGHSSGEIAAAYAAGLISTSEAMILAYYRGKAIRDVTANGAMLAVGIGAEAVTPYTESSAGEVVIACHNSPTSVTLSGNADALTRVKGKLDEDGVFVRFVKTDGKAYHSPHMAPISIKYEALIRHGKHGICLNRPQKGKGKMVSSVTNRILPENSILDEKYWSTNLLSPVLFNQAVQTIGSDPQFADVDILVEIGPHSTLSGPIRQIRSECGFEKLQYLPSLIRGADSAASLLRLVGELFLRNYPVRLESVTANEETASYGKIIRKNGSLIVDLPPYQWDVSKKYWAECRESREFRTPRFPRHDVLGSLVPGCSRISPVWRNILRIRDLPWLADHSLGGEAVFPAAGYFSMAMEAIMQLNEMTNPPAIIEGYLLRDLSFRKALVTPDDETGIEILLNMHPSVHMEAENPVQWWDFKVTSVYGNRQAEEHMSGSIRINDHLPRPNPRKFPTLPQRSSGKAWNQALKRVGFDYGSTFQDMENIRFDGKKYVATCATRIRTNVEGMANESRYILHPATIDSCLQLLIVANFAGRTSAMPAGAVPIYFEELAVWKPTEAQFAEPAAKALSWVDPRGSRSFVGHNQLVSGDGQVLMELNNVRCVLYEACVQTISEPSSPEPYGSIVWNLDVDELKGIQEMDLTRYLELLIFKYPGVKVLSIGAQQAALALKRIPDLDIIVTEATEQKVDILKEQFQSYQFAQVQLLNLDQDFQSQSLEGDSFDVIITSDRSLCHAAKIRQLLKDDGRVLLDCKALGPNDTLEWVGFSDIKLRLNVSGDHTMIVTKAVSSVGISNSFSAHLIYRETPPNILDPVRHTLENSGYQVRVSGLCSPQVGETQEGEQIIILADFGNALLPSMTDTEFIGLQKITENARNILWITSGGLMVGKIPEFAMASGLLRSLRSERSSLNAVTVDFDMDTVSIQDVAEVISSKAIEQIDATAFLKIEPEYYVSKNEVFISRLLPNSRINAVYANDRSEVQQRTFDSNTPLTGTLDSGRVVFIEDYSDEQPLPPSYVEICVLATGLNFEDVLTINGQGYDSDFSHEIGGIVTKLGPMTTGFEIGDRVVGFSFDRFSTLQRVQKDMLQKLNPDEVMEDLVGLPMAYATALYGLKRLANLQPGEDLLVLPGTGFAGRAAVKIATALGARAYVVVEDEHQLEAVAENLGLDRGMVMSSKQLSLQGKVGGLYNYDVVFSSNRSDPTLIRDTWRHISLFGRFIQIGQKNLLSRALLDATPLARGANYFSFNIPDFYKSKSHVLTKLLAETFEMYRVKAIRDLQPPERKAISELNQSVADFSDDFGSRKIVILHEPSEGPLDVLPSRPVLKLRSDATYFLVGCLGGLGRSLTYWMSKKGAKNFAFLSRSGADSREAALLVDELRRSGKIVQVFKGDVSVREDVENAIRGVPSERPIRGVIQAAMVLRDGLFPTLSHNSWTASIGPKVHGTQNLHTCLQEHSVDFFISTSSISCILGMPGQSNYAAGNSYLNALSRHRLSRKQNSTSIILPMVLGVGVIAENVKIEEKLTGQGMYGIDEDSLLRAFEVAMLQQEMGGELDHLVVGLEAAELRKSGRALSGNSEAFWAGDPRFKALAHAMRLSDDAAVRTKDNQGILAALTSSSSQVESLHLVRAHFAAKLSRMLMRDLSEFEDEGRSIESYGVDSMTGAELRNWIFKEFGVDVTFQTLLGHEMTIERFAEMVCKKYA